MYYFRWSWNERIEILVSDFAPPLRNYHNLRSYVNQPWDESHDLDVRHVRKLANDSLQTEGGPRTTKRDTWLNFPIPFDFWIVEGEHNKRKKMTRKINFYYQKLKVVAIGAASALKELSGKGRWCGIRVALNFVDERRWESIDAACTLGWRSFVGSVSNYRLLITRVNLRSVRRRGSSTDRRKAIENISESKNCTAATPMPLAFACNDLINNTLQPP